MPIARSWALRGLQRIRTGLAAAVAMAIVLPVLVLAAVPAAAALGGRTDFAIDGNTDGPNDWDAPPASLLDLVNLSDACGNGVVDPTTVSGKLDDFDWRSWRHRGARHRRA